MFNENSSLLVKNELILFLENKSSTWPKADILKTKQILRKVAFDRSENPIVRLNAIMALRKKPFVHSGELPITDPLKDIILDKQGASSARIQAIENITQIAVEYPETISEIIPILQKTVLDHNSFLAQFGALLPFFLNHKQNELTVRKEAIQALGDIFLAYPKMSSNIPRILKKTANSSQPVEIKSEADQVLEDIFIDHPELNTKV